MVVVMGHTHSAAGVLGWVALAPHVSDDPVVWLAGLLPAYLLPLGADLDHPNSRSSRALFGPLHRFAGDAVATTMGGHRAGMHSLWMTLAVTYLWFLAGALVAPSLALPLAGMALAGWGGGVWPDMLTKQGVKVLWPLSSRSYGLRIFQTNGTLEYLFRVALYLGAVWVAYLHWTPA